MDSHFAPELILTLDIYSSIKIKNKFTTEDHGINTDYKIENKNY